MAHFRRQARHEHYKPFGRRKVNENETNEPSYFSTNSRRILSKRPANRVAFVCRSSIFNPTVFCAASNVSGNWPTKELQGRSSLLTRRNDRTTTNTRSANLRKRRNKVSIRLFYTGVPCVTVSILKIVL